MMYNYKQKHKRELRSLERVGALSRPEKEKRDPQERVEHMNSIFDRLVLPMILFTLAVFIIFGVIPKLGGCGGKEEPAAETETASSPYDLRKALLDDIAGNQAVFEAAGYTVTEVDGETVAYRKLDSGVEIFDNLKDSNGYPFSLISYSDEAAGTETDIMLYSEAIFLVVVKSGENQASAIFGDDSFSCPPSGGDADMQEVLGLVSAETLSGMVSEYLASVESVVK